jgi:hypothetical protein
MTHAATSKVGYSAQGSSCKLKFVHGVTYKPFVFGLIMLNVVMLSVIMLSVVAHFVDKKPPKLSWIV